MNRLVRSWRELVVELAGPGADIRQGVAPEGDGTIVAELTVPGAAFRAPGATEDEAWRRLAHWLGNHRLVLALEGAGWKIVEEVVDETTYVVARDPRGTLWAIGVASTESDRGAYIERDIGYDRRAFDRIAFVEPIDTRDAATLVAALEASDKPDRSDDRS